MAAAKLKLSIEQGATFRHTLTIRDVTTGQPVDLTGYIVRAHFRNAYSDAVPLFTLTMLNGRIIVTPLAGVVALYISATDTAALSFTTALYDLELESSSGEVTRILKGTVSLSPEVTK